MSAKLGFVAGLAVGVLAGSRAGRGLYDRTASAASAVVRDPRVRSGATTVMHKAGDAGSSVAGAAARKVKSRGKADGDPAEDAEGNGDAERGPAALRGRTKRLMGGVRKHAGAGINGKGHWGGANGSSGGSGVKISRPHLHRPHLHRTDHAAGADHYGDHAHNGARHGGMSAPYVQPKPVKDEE